MKSQMRIRQINFEPELPHSCREIIELIIFFLIYDLSQSILEKRNSVTLLCATIPFVGKSIQSTFFVWPLVQILIRFSGSFFLPEILKKLFVASWHVYSTEGQIYANCTTVYSTANYAFLNICALYTLPKYLNETGVV